VVNKKEKITFKKENFVCQDKKQPMATRHTERILYKRRFCQKENIKGGAKQYRKKENHVLTKKKHQHACNTSDRKACEGKYSMKKDC